MRTYTLLSAVLLTGLTVNAQLAINPQLGLSFQSLSNTPDGVTSKADIGWMLGSDLRIGKRLYFQPGVFYSNHVTTITVGDSAQVEDDLARSFLNLKALAGYNLIDGSAFRLRANAGVSYDLLLNVKEGDKIEFDKNDFESGVWNANVGVGADISLITLETGIMAGLTDVFSDEVNFDEEVKHFIWYFTVGIVLGGSNK